MDAGQWRGKRALVVGMARSGLTSAKLLHVCGADVTLYDAKPREKLVSALHQLGGIAVTEAFGVNPIAWIESHPVDLMVLSPGVPYRTPFIEAAKARGIEVIAEIELGYRAAQAPIVAIGGTNGKTTTTALTGAIFEAAGRNTYVLGNIGEPLTKCALETKPDDVIVAEIASLQLESTSEFRPRSCALLNITEDHLDRFGTMDYYIDVKCKMFANQRPEDVCCLNADDLIASSLCDRVKGRLLRFSRLREVEEGAFVRDGWITFRMDGRETPICPAADVRIPGAHNLENALAAVCVSMPMGVSAAAAAEALRTFPGVEHRIERVCEKNGVCYINDSKATNPDSSIKAVQAMTRPTVLLLGGSNKNSDYTPLFRAFDGKIKAVVALGETADQILRDAKITGYSAIHHCAGSFEDAVRLAASLAEAGDNVLLSPACASYDMFDNYEVRGRVFKAIVTNF